jgi:plasmid maintenance system antidote protein VapI
MPTSSTKRLTSFARALDVSYDRLQRVLTGKAVMQLEDVGRLSQHIGTNLELWALSPTTAEQVAHWRRAAAHERAVEHARRQAGIGQPPRSTRSLWG